MLLINLYLQSLRHSRRDAVQCYPPALHAAALGSSDDCKLSGIPVAQEISFLLSSPLLYAPQPCGRFWLFIQTVTLTSKICIIPHFLQTIKKQSFLYKREIYIMKATGIVRRIDDLGRVVIPKEIRRTMRIREGDPLQITRTRFKEQCVDDFLMAMLEFGERMYINK